MGEALGQGGLPDPRCACYEYDIAQVCDLVLRPGHSGSLEPFEPGSPDRESGILSAKIVDRAILPEQGLRENKFQLRIVVFSNLIMDSKFGDNLPIINLSNDAIEEPQSTTKTRAKSSRLVQSSVDWSGVFRSVEDAEGHKQGESS